MLLKRVHGIHCAPWPCSELHLTAWQEAACSAWLPSLGTILITAARTSHTETVQVLQSLHAQRTASEMQCAALQHLIAPQNKCMHLTLEDCINELLQLATHYTKTPNKKEMV